MSLIIPVIIGLVAGYLSGQFGIGGGFLMQPALRLIVGTTALVSLGTPIPVIIVSAITGSYNYYRNGFIDWRLAPYLFVSGIVSSVLGSLVTKAVNGELLLLITAVALMLTATRFIRGSKRAEAGEAGGIPEEKLSLAASITGFVAGFFSGLLGLGGGFLLVPALTIIFRKDMKTALGTSLFAIIAYSIPSAITHYYLGHVNPLLALLLAIGIIPGAYIGSKVAIGLPEDLLRRLFGIFLFVVAFYFAFFEARMLFGF